MKQITIQSLDELEKYKDILKEIKVWVCSTSCGKSYLCSIDDRFFDLDSYQWSAADDEESCEKAAIKKMHELLKEGKIITQASHGYFMKYVYENKIPFVFMYGKPEVQEEYCERMLHRGSGEEFVQKFGIGIASRYAEKASDERPTVKIELNPKEFVSDCMWRVFGKPSKYVGFNSFDPQKYKVAFVDIDDTLLDRKGELTEFTKQTISKIKDKIQFVLTSTRSRDSVLPLMQELGLTRESDRALCGFGALVINGRGEPVEVDQISSEKLDFFIQKAGKNVLDGCYFNTLSGRVYYNDIKDFKKFAVENTIYKIVRPLKRDEDFKMPEEIANDFYLFYGQHIIEIVNKNCEKFNSAQKFLRQNNLSLEDAVAIGDSEADLKLLENVGCGIAVCNANWDIKNKVRYIADSNNDDGVAKALLKILSI